MPRFSIITAVHNRPDLVRETLDSILAQPFADREVIVVDDASTDQTPAVLAAYGPAIRIVTLPSNQGTEQAYRAGVDAARGDYVLFLDSDDLFFPWALPLYDFVLRATANPALLVSRLRYFRTEKPALAPPRAGDRIEIVSFSDYLARDRTMGSSLSMIVLRRDVYAASSGFRRSTATTFNMSDHDILLRVGCAGPAILLEQPHTVAYRYHSENSVGKLSRVAAGVLRLVAAERRGEYPGGKARRFERRSAIGGPAAHFSRQALQRGRVLLAARLFFGSFDMIAAKIVRRLVLARRGPVPSQWLEWPG